MPGQIIGFIGLGIMGQPMAKNLIDAGYTVIGYNRSEGPVNELVEYGGHKGESPADVGEKADIIITCLPNSPHVKDVVLGDNEDGLISGMGRGETLIDMSTISPVVAEEIAETLNENGIDMLDAPISGGEEGAIEGTLSIMVGGEPTVLDSNREILQELGDNITHCGSNGSGQVTKACNQIVVGGTHQAVAEALMLAECAGTDLEAVLEAITPGAANCWSLEARAPDVIRGNFEPGFFSSYQYKDLRIATDAGKEYGAPMPSTSVAHEMYKAMENTGRGQDDHSAVIQILEDMAGEKARIDGQE